MTHYRYLNNPNRTHPDDREAYGWDGDWTAPDPADLTPKDDELTAEDLAAWDAEMLKPSVIDYAARDEHARQLHEQAQQRGGGR